MALTLQQQIDAVISSVFPTVLVSTGDIAQLNLNIVTQSLGAVSSSEVIGMLANRYKIVGQLSTDLTTDRGIGSFGFNIVQLVNTGYIKQSVLESLQQMGTVSLATSTGLGIVPYKSYIDPNLTLSYINTPGSWTGLNNINSVNDFLANYDLQQSTYAQVLEASYVYINESKLIASLTTTEAIVFELAIAGGLGYSIIEAFANGVNDSIVNTYGVNATQASNKASGASSAANNLGAGVAAGTLEGISNSLGSSASSVVSGSLTQLNSVLSNFTQADLTTKPVAIEASLFFNNLIPTLPLLAGTLNSVLTNPSGALNSAVNGSLNSLLSGPLAKLNSVLNLGASFARIGSSFGSTRASAVPVAGTLNRAALTASVTRIIRDPTDPNSSKIELPVYAVPASGDTFSSSLLQAAKAVDSLKSQLNVSSLNTNIGAATNTIKNITNNLSG